jgi:uncharacterized membrane protein
MKLQIAFIVIAIALLLPAQALAVSDHIEYNISVSEDGSAFWTIIHVTDIDSPVDGWEEFEQKLISTINTAKDSTARDMALDFASLEMSTQIHWETSSKTIVYIFRWQNFSIVDDGQIIFGDVFSDGFFSFLYGDGELYVTYPTEYILSSVSSGPSQLDDTTQTLHWYRTQDFLAGTQNILLKERNVSSNDVFNLFNVAVLGLGGLSIAAIGFFIFTQRRRQKKELSKLDGFPTRQEVESDQEKILRLLKSSGGNLKQSEVCDKLRFSRAKTSLLLAEMERNCLVRRCKKGKNKIVFRMESREGRNF